MRRMQGVIRAQSKRAKATAATHVAVRQSSLIEANHSIAASLMKRSLQ
jgi:hypothetical protein